MKEDNLLWQIRYFVYSHIAETTRPPRVDEAAAHLGISIEEATEFYKELHNRHAVFLDLDKMAIRMANPFSGIPTDFKVLANDKTYFANCAWDMFGIPAALHCDALIDAVCTGSNDTVRIEIKDGQITNHQFTNSQLLIHFPLPFARWYDDLVFT